MDANLAKVKESLDKIILSTGFTKDNAIREACEDEYTKRALIMQADPTITFGFNLKKIDKQVSVPPRKTHTDLLTLCDYMRKQKNISDWHIASAQEYIQSQPMKLQEFARYYIAKALVLGAASRIINTAVGEDVIKNFGCMTGYEYTDPSATIDGREFFVSEMLGGIRCLAFISPKGVELYTRAGNRIKGYREVERELSELCALGARFRLEGELLPPVTENLFESGWHGPTAASTQTDEEKQEAVYHVLDIVSDAIDKQPYRYRQSTLRNIIRQSAHVVIDPPLYFGSDESVIQPMFEKVIAAGRPGLNVHLADEPYHYRRTSTMIKYSRIPPVAVGGKKRQDQLQYNGREGEEKHEEDLHSPL
ncbi:MAG: hypothetical protein Q4A66_12290 [Eubacteriales bacterium]|nr:hypothetical protein [Eubacteriales bacterium]